VLLPGNAGEEVKVAYCTNCGSEVESSDRFCRHCGAVAAETRQASSDAESGMREVTTNGTSDSEPDSRGPSAQVGADENSFADETQQRVSVSESNPESDGTSPRTRTRTKRVFVVILACVVVAGAAGAVMFFTSRSKSDQSRNSTASLSPSQRKVENCVTTIGVPAEEAINDLENFNESAMATVMAGFSVSHGAAEYGVLQSVVSDVSQHLMSASWAVSWKSAIKHEFPTIESFCNKRYSISSVSTSTTIPSATQNPLTLSIKIAGQAIPAKKSLEKWFEHDWSNGSKINSGVFNELVSMQLQYLPSEPSWVFYQLNFTDADPLEQYAQYVNNHWVYRAATGSYGVGRPVGMPSGALKTIGVSISWNGTPSAEANNLKFLLAQSHECQSEPTIAISPPGGGSRSVKCQVTKNTSLIVGIEIFSNAKKHRAYLKANLKPCTEAALLEDNVGYGVLNSANWTALVPIADVLYWADSIGGEVLWPTNPAQITAVEHDFPNGCS